MKIAVLAVFCAALAGASPIAIAQACRSGTSEYAREQIAPNRVRIYCVCHAELNAMRDTDAEIRRLESALESDRAAIGKWQAELPDFMRSLDEWVGLDERARVETRARAVDAALGAGLGLLQIRAQQNVRMTQAEMQKLWQEFNASGLGSPRFHQILSEQNARAVTIRQWQNMEEFAQSANDLQNAVGSLDAARREEYGRALINLLALGLRDPRLGILAAELDFAATAVLGNVTAHVARARVQQLVNLGDARLRALASLASRYRLDVDAMKRAKAQREQILQRAANPAASCPPGPVSTQ